MNHDRNCASRWQASSECDCGADRVNSEEAIHTLESVNRALETERDQAVNELTVCRALLDSYGFHQTGIHNGIAAMQRRILNLESMLKSFD